VIARPAVSIVLFSAVGIGGLIAAQTFLLGSRHPVAPFLAFVIGVISLQPVLSWHERLWPDTQRENKLTDLRQLAALVVLIAIAIAQSLTLPSPPGSNTLNVFLVALMIVVIYGVGWVYGDAWVGLIAAGFVATSGWTLALSKSDPVYVAASAISGLYLIILYNVRRTEKRITYLAAGASIGVGGLMFQPFIYMALLLPLLLLLKSLDERPTTRKLGAMLLNLVLAYIVTIVFLLPGIVAPQSVQADVPPDIIANPQLTVSEGLFTSLLMFNLASDPNPLHGIVDRPVFPPVLAAAFIVGLLALAWRLNDRRRWSDAFLLCALVVGLLPTVLLLDLPVSYPDLRAAAPALPIAVVIAALGASMLIRLLVLRMGKTGFIIAAGLLIVALSAVVFDARQHYINKFWPAYGRSAPVDEQLSLKDTP
jgi:4-amino-4-deoxy-L-arabinose transferase-like glycosyltransferase